MRFFLDEGVPRSVGKFLEAEGFEVLYLEDKIAKGSKDTLVAAVSEANDAVLVAFDSDFKSIVSRQGIGQRRFRTLSLLRFEKCRESQAVHRLERALSLIRHEWKLGNGPSDRRMFVVITASTIRTHR
jgi:predicted nuclease of predicted toxin-antitoxin system